MKSLHVTSYWYFPTGTQFNALGHRVKDTFTGVSGVLAKQKVDGVDAHMGGGPLV